MSETKVKRGVESKRKSIGILGCTIKPTKKRYFILFLYVVLTSTKSFQWICLASITNVVAHFYRVDNLAVNWTTVVFMFTFLTLAIPVNWVMEKIGLRWSVLIGSIGVTVGLIIKCFSIEPDRFWLTMLGHVIIGVVEPFFFSTYSQVAFAWFPDDQVAMATATGIVGESLGIALGFLVPNLMVGSDLSDEARIHWGMETMFLTMTVICLINTILIMFFFDERPKYAPGIARFNQLSMEIMAEEKGEESTKSVRNFIKVLGQFYGDKNFVLLQIGFGFIMGTSYAFHTILNQIVSGNHDEDPSHPNLVTGNVGLILLVAGIFGSIVCGFLLDKFHAYKVTTDASYLFSFLFMLAFTYCLRLNSPIALYLISVPLGVFLTSYSCCGYEFSVELTYPKSELVASTLLNISAEVFGIVVTFVGSHVTDTYGSTCGCLVMSGFLAIGLLSSSMVEPKYNRQTLVEEGKVRTIRRFSQVIYI